MALDYDKLMEFSAEFGYRLTRSGAETYRVEQSMRFLLCAYGISDAEVFAIPNCIIVTLISPEGRPVTQIRRVTPHGTDIDQLERLNSLCRQLCRETPPLEEAFARLEDCLRTQPEYRLPVHLLGYFIGCGSFGLFYGGCWLDGLCSGLCGLLVGLFVSAMNRLHSNIYFKTVVCAMVSATLAILLVRLGIGVNQEKIIIGALMVLVPGIAFTNGMRDVIAGDMVSGISKITEALFIGTTIALGTAIPLGVMHMLGRI